MLTRSRRTITGALAAVLLAGAVSCGGGGNADTGSAEPAPVTTVADPPGTTRGTNPPAAASDEDVEALDGIGEDDSFPELGTPDLDVDDYALDLAYQPDTGELEGTATIEATLMVHSDQIELDFQGLDVGAASVDGEQVEHELADDKLVLELTEPTDAGTEVTVVVDYRGVPEPVPTDALGGVEVGWHGGEDGSFVLSEPEGASTWYPVNNHPLDKATYTFRVTVPDPYTAIANGALLSTTPEGDATTFEWRMDAPMASYLATVVTGEFEEAPGGVHDDVAYSYWYAKGVAPSPDLEKSDRLVAELARRLGPFPFDTYGGVVYPPSFINGNGRTEGFLSGVALETQGRSLFAEGTTVPAVIIHEAAHQWMGDNVSLTDWSRDIWWIEGFAHFAEYIDDVDALAADYAEVKASWVPPGNLPVDELFTGGSYECGAMVFYALYREVGEEPFWEILREFNTRYRHGNASTDDLIEVASDVSGEDLSDFFEAWLFDEVPPKLPT